MTAPPEIGIVTGLAAEAASICQPFPGRAGQAPALVFCSGASAARAREGAGGLVAKGVRGLVSFGVAGGLDPALEHGALVLADAVVTPEGERIATHAGWREWVLVRAREAGALTVAPVAGSDVPVTTVAGKRALHEASGAVAVDMESHAVAAAAVAAGLPFLVLRAVADPARRAIPEWTLQGLGADGRTRPLAVSLGLLVRPWEATTLMSLGRDMAAALRALRRVAKAGVPPFPAL